MLTRVEIGGFKCLRDVTVDLGPFNVVIGPNDSGKSSLLQALGVAWRFGQGGGLPQPGSSFQFFAGAALLARVAHTVGGGWLQPMPRPCPEVLHTMEPLMFDAVQIASPSPRGSGALQTLIASRGRGVGAHLARTALGDRARYEAIQRGMTEITAGRVLEMVVGEDTGAGYPLHFRLFDGTLLPASEVSQGLLLYLGFLCIIHREDAPSILLLEEPENGLHPLRLHEVVKLLRGLTTQGVQIVMSTHSPDLLNACKPEEVIVLRRPEPQSGTEVHRLPKDFDKRAMRSTMGEIWASRGEEGLLDMLPTVDPSVHADP